ncbi:COX5A-domain-containing protein [Mrakia frigida]|uniref:COX5A-domain-containing protein n=1 Tax=Mrakia frigida TaxID=29902 RepID=UPI003FCC1FC7
MFRSVVRKTSPLMSMSKAAAFRPAVGAVPRLGLRFSSHEAESYDEFNDRYQLFFDQAPDLFELQRGMNNCFAYDLVPTVEVIESMIRAARRFDDFPTAVRAIEAVGFKVEKRSQYEAYVEALSPLMTELGEFFFAASWC